MRSSSGFGAVLGIVLSILSIAGNIRRGDPHLVSVSPGLVGAVVLTVAIYLFVRRQRARMERRDLMWFGLRQVFVAATTFAIIFAAFTRWWLPGPGSSLVYVSFLATLGIVMALGGCTVMVAAGFPRHPKPVRTPAG